TMMTCHLSIRPVATCTVPRTQLLAASRRHVAASYWTAASDVAPTSASVSAGQRRRPSVNAAVHRSTAAVHGGDRRSTTPATGQRRRITVVIGGRRWRSTTVAGGEPLLTAAGPPLTTTGQRWLVGWSTLGTGPVWIGSGSGLGRVWAGSGSGL
nr:hypothetical protein [Tanacetum cinerariifolium]